MFRSVFFVIFFLGQIFALSAPAQASTGKSADKNKVMSLNMTNSSLKDLLKSAGKVLGKSYSADPNQCERFNIRAPENLTPIEAQIILESALLSHGYSLVAKENYVIVRNVKSLSDQNGPCRPMAQAIVTTAFRLKALSPTEAMHELIPHLTREALMDEVPGGKTLIVSDQAHAIEKARIFLKQHDPTAGI